MKVPASVRALYEAQYPLAERLQTHVDNALQIGKPNRWHYVSRLKQLQSYAVKIESGRVENPSELEDFLACTLVVTNSAALSEAIEWVKSKFTIVYQRPKIIGETRKHPDSFPFDDLRLYCVRGNDGSRPDEPIDSVVFEVQVKTFLQHAWGIATHDLSYKTDDVRWGKDRIVAHLKAAIEFAEISIQQAETLSRGEALQLSHHATNQVSDTITILQKHWTRQELPENLRGLAETVLRILQDAKLNTADLDDMLTREGQAAGLPANLSPYGTIIQLLISKKRETMEKMLANQKLRSRLLLTPEVNLPADFLPGNFPDRLVMVR